MSDDWVPPGYVNVAALARQRGVDRVRSDLFSGRLQAYKWDGTAGEIYEIEPRHWCADAAEQWLAQGWMAHHSEECPPCMVVVRIEDESKPPPVPDGVYQSPFVALMQAAVQHFEISEQRCPKKEVLEEHFRKQKVDGKLVSKNLASQLATLCRPPAAMRGGNRKKA